MSHEPALAQTNGEAASPFGSQFADVLQARRQEADEFYAAIIPAALNADQTNVMRQALAGMMWSKQFYHYDVDKWLEERGSDPFKPSRKQAPQRPLAPHVQRRHHFHARQMGVSLVCGLGSGVSCTRLDAGRPGFCQGATKADAAGTYMHPNGQIPAYEWNFGDVNPPVHAWSTIFTYRLEKLQKGEGDMDWLKSSFHKLLLNFTWWVNRRSL